MKFCFGSMIEKLSKHGLTWLLLWSETRIFDRHILPTWRHRRRALIFSLHRRAGILILHFVEFGKCICSSCLRNTLPWRPSFDLGISAPYPSVYFHVFLSRPGCRIIFLVTNLFHIGYFPECRVLYPLLFNRRTWWLCLLAIGIILALSYYVKLFVVHRVLPGFELNSFNNRICFSRPRPFCSPVSSSIYRRSHA